jgi:hypothetical protein
MTMLTITGLTTKQVSLLDEMWAIDGADEYLEWKAAQPNREEIELLEQMVVLADIDFLAEESLTEANLLLSRFL